MNCACSNLDQVIDLADLPESFLNTLEELEIDVENWARLYACTNCGQHWRIDEWDKLQTQCGIKLSNPIDWGLFDTEPLRKEFLLNIRGGEEPHGVCAMKDCERLPVKDVAYCVDHLYETGTRR